MMRIKALLFLCVLHCSAQCRSTGRGASVLFTYLDDTVQQAIHASSKLDFIENIHSISKIWHKWYTACLVTSVQEWTKMKVPCRFPNMCGNIGSLKIHPVSRMWTIKKLHSSVGILLNIIYMDLPFGGGRCQFGYIIINNNHYCGRRSHWAICMNSDATVYLQQRTTLLPGMGFVATHSATDGTCRFMPNTVHRLFEDASFRFNYTQVIYDAYKQDDVSQYIWHVVVAHNKLIEFKVEADHHCKIYDVPGPRSPALYNSTRSSAYHLYIAKQNPNIVLKYTSVDHTSFSTDNKYVLQSSVRGKNIMYAYKVTGGPFGLRVNFLSIHSNNILSDFPTRCLFGGLFLFGYDYNNVYFEVPICDTDWKEEVFFHLTNTVIYSPVMPFHIFIILYDGYTRGKVDLCVESVEPCYIVLGDRAHAQCQYLYPLSPNQRLDWFFNIPAAGPLNLKVYILPAIYDLYNARMNISVMDYNPLGFNNTVRTDIVGTHSNISYQNPTSFIVKEIHGHQFNTWRIAILKFSRVAVCDHELINQKYHNITGAQKVTMQPHHSGCRCVVDGHLQYSVVIMASDINIYTELQFSDYCKAGCVDGSITVTEYNRQYDRLIVHRFKSFPVVWDNIHSINSVLTNMTVPDNCKRCPLWIVSTPSWQTNFFETVKLSSNIKKFDASLPVEYSTR